MATEVLGELALFYNRWPKGDKKGPEVVKGQAWVGGVTGLLISLLL